MIALRVEMMPDGAASVIYDNGERIGRNPGEDISDLPADMQAQINAIWTTSFVSAYVLAQARLTALANVTAAKQAALASMAYSFGGQTYQITLAPQDQIDVMGALQMLGGAPGGTTLSWEIVDGQFVTFALADVQALYAAGQAHVQACYANAKALIAAIQAASDPVALLAIDVSLGWPT